MAKPILTIYNRHSSTCGSPPPMSNEGSGLYMGYFENRYREQWLFTYNRETREARLRGGDIGWEDEREVRDGRVDDLILGTEEATWLQACWKAATA